MGLDIVKTNTNTQNNESMFQKLHGVDKAEDILKRSLSREQAIVINYDPDVDGIFAGYFIEKYLRYKYDIIPKVSINKNRGHGLVDFKCMDSSKELYVDDSDLKPYPKNSLIINVDSGISSEQLKDLVEQGFDVISLDHHELEYSDEDDTNSLLQYDMNEHTGIIINNQYSFEDPKYSFQSGSGVVLTFIENITENYVNQDMISMNAVTLLSDSRDIDNDLAYRFLNTLYTTGEVSAPNLYAMAKNIGFSRYTEGLDTVDRTYVDFMLSPHINASMRCNKGYETIHWINWLDISLGDSKKLQREVIEEFNHRCIIHKYNYLYVIEIPSNSNDWFTASNFIGLYANQFLDTGHSVVIYSTKEGVLERGSFRGLYPSVDYRSAFEKMGFIALGHPMAFGLKNMKYGDDLWTVVDEYIGVLQGKRKVTQSIYEMADLSRNRKKLQELAEYNDYHTNNKRSYVKYKGFNIKLVTDRPKIRIYLIDGLVVTSFDVDLMPQESDAYILPMKDKGNLKLYLQIHKY